MASSQFIRALEISKAMTEHSQKNARPPEKTGGKTISAERALAARLIELGIDPVGLPPHVTAHLRAEVDAEAARIQEAFVAAVAALQGKTDEQLRKQIARLVTFKTVGKAFALPAGKPPGGAAK